MIPETVTVTSEHISFHFLVFCLHFLVVGSVRQIKLTHVGFRVHVKITSRIVSYRINEVTEVLRLVTVFGRVYHLGI